MDFPIWVLFLFSILICNFDRTTAQNDFWGEYCGGSGNYTDNSGYQQDLDDLLNSITDTNNGFGFYKSTVGEATAAALCRGDIIPENCRSCVEDNARRLRQVCQNQVEATGLDENCFLRYSNRSTGSGVSVISSSSNRNNISDSDYDQWNRTVEELLGKLRAEAAGGGRLRKYASGNITVPGLPIIFAITQCTPDLSETECNECLTGAIVEIRRYDRNLGARVYKTSCGIRYQTYSFFGSTWFPAPAPAPASSGTNIGIIVGPILAAIVVIAVVVFLITKGCQKPKRKGPLLPEFQVGYSDGSPERSTHEREDDDTGEMNFFCLSAIQVATNDFSYENKLGEGGFGPVYRGKLQDGREIAVKRLSMNSGQGLVEFKNEVELIIKLQHKNLVRLLGYCIKGPERLLIYEYMANNSLDTFLFDPIKCKELDWGKRANIISGIAKGLRYLHEDSRLKIIHRDMKAGNILLDHDMNSKISDFGTARIFGGNQMEANTIRIVGTYGYMAPEYAMEGLFSTKSDVYSFGVLLLEIISGQRNNKFCYQNQPQNFLTTVWRSWKENKGEELIDRRLSRNFPTDEALKWINIALLCVQKEPDDRPTMSTVVFMLEGQWSANFPSPLEPPLSFRSPTMSEHSTILTGDTSGPPSLVLTGSTTKSR
ncbi:cysteine-rich receptor-like protein kinase 8 [Cynara cardunculus var. scolymus]|uniref:cysteine-rich receptor-like protein kinase 8 n=1 Tax=Cynara cardunculus var. scolymus TaxID=59895 RepID=UPI000D62BF71|nr:cysteine-rich receptor-like protein kinase 8 [Cynara cardunculus var. scolymus]